MIATKLKLAAVICLLSCSYIPEAFGCRYTVRDVGFVDLGFQPYQLCCFFRDDTPQQRVDVVKRISYAALRDSNVKVEMVNIDRQKDHPVWQVIRPEQLKSFPAAVLVSAEGRSLMIPLSDSKVSFEETVSAAMDSVVISPVRREILENIVKKFCVILLLQGKDSVENEKAREIVSAAPRAFGEPARLIEITPEMSAQEGVLLWSLGLSRSEMEKPHVAVLYGRGRRIGPIFRAEAITDRAVFNIFSVLDAHCECGLDRSWMMGALLPLRWEEKIQQEVANVLGFDAESPWVKMEVSRVLGAGPLSTVANTAYQGLSQESVLRGREPVVGIEIEPSVAMMLAEMRTQKIASSRPESIYRPALYIVVAMVVLVLAGGAFIIWRARRRRL